MFGYFTAADNQSSQGFDAPLLAINRSMYPLHAWLKRAASKVTVNVDGSGLYDNVQVWIHSVQVRDIPRYCYLGADHSVSAHLISEGEYITYSTAGGQTGRTVTKADPINSMPKTPRLSTSTRTCRAKDKTSIRAGTAANP